MKPEYTAVPTMECSVDVTWLYRRLRAPRTFVLPLHWCFTAIALIAMQFVFAQDHKGRPNIILIMADDLGYETLACNGNDVNRTPNLDRLAAKGMRFTSAYSTPLCTPTRVQMMTGKYNFRNYVGFGLLKHGEKTFAHLLKNEGYATGIAGKWQLLGNEKQRKLAGGKIGSRPEEAGFDKYCLWQIDSLGSRFKDPLIVTNGESKTYHEKYGPDIFADFALRFIEQNRDSSFFLYYPMVLTHDPFQYTPNTPGFKDFDVTTDLNDPEYFKDMVEYMDMIVGRIVDKVHESGLSKNTIILFTGDNGTHRSVVSSFQGKPFRGDKGQTTKFGTHVPLIAYWDGIIENGRVNDNLVDFTDFLPTIMDAVNAKVPRDFHTDGLSFYKQLLNKKVKAREWVYCAYDPNWGGRKAATWAHNHKWKLYGDDRLYDLENDPEENNPLSGQQLNAAAKKAKKALATALEKYKH